ncbi:MAG: hypothetical protein D6766_12465 [Verrucomicrobia bacterium]|nr:MAG: hypothetical protein D6766_12465 [Verrucomicrobiota bacterium]
MRERGATEEEVRATVEFGERFPVRFGRTAFRRNFPFESEWRGRFCRSKQVEAIAVEEDGWLVITVLALLLKGGRHETDLRSTPQRRLPEVP